MRKLIEQKKKKCIAEDDQPQDYLPSCNYSLGLNNLVTLSIEKKKAGRKRVLKHRNAANRKIRIFENVLDAEKKKSAKYKKQYQRLQGTKNVFYQEGKLNTLR